MALDLGSVLGVFRRVLLLRGPVQLLVDVVVRLRRRLGGGGGGVIVELRVAPRGRRRESRGLDAGGRRGVVVMMLGWRRGRKARGTGEVGAVWTRQAGRGETRGGHGHRAL